MIVGAYIRPTTGTPWNRRSVPRTVMIRLEMDIRTASVPNQVENRIMPMSNRIDEDFSSPPRGSRAVVRVPRSVWPPVSVVTDKEVQMIVYNSNSNACFSRRISPWAPIGPRGKRFNPYPIPRPVSPCTSAEQFPAWHVVVRTDKVFFNNAVVIRVRFVTVHVRLNNRRGEWLRQFILSNKLVFELCIAQIFRGRLDEFFLHWVFAEPVDSPRRVVDNCGDNFQFTGANKVLYDRRLHEDHFERLPYKRFGDNVG